MHVYTPPECKPRHYIAWWIGATVAIDTRFVRRLVPPAHTIHQHPPNVTCETCSPSHPSAHPQPQTPNAQSQQERHNAAVALDEPAGYPTVEEHQATNSHKPQATDPAEPDAVYFWTPIQNPEQTAIFVTPRCMKCGPWGFWYCDSRCWHPAHPRMTTSYAGFTMILCSRDWGMASTVGFIDVHLLNMGGCTIVCKHGSHPHGVSPWVRACEEEGTCDIGE